MLFSGAAASVHIAKRDTPYQPSRPSYRDLVSGGGASQHGLYAPWSAYPAVEAMTPEEYEHRRSLRASQRQPRSHGVLFARAEDGKVSL